MAAPMNLDVGMSGSSSTAIRTGPFSATQGDWIVGGSAPVNATTGAPTTGAAAWPLILAIAAIALVAIAGPALVFARLLRRKT